MTACCGRKVAVGAERLVARDRRLGGGPETGGPAGILVITEFSKSGRAEVAAAVGTFVHVQIAGQRGAARGSGVGVWGSWLVGKFSDGGDERGVVGGGRNGAFLDVLAGG